ncbi:MAG: metallophosphoesterase [Myxococcota bacterium]
MFALTRREMIEALFGAPALRRLLQEGGPGDARMLEPTLARINVPVAGLDRRLDGMRIGQISDAHIGAFLGLDHLERAVAPFLADPPDIMTVTGDLLDDASLMPACLEIVSRIKAPYGRFIIMGNHENYAGRDDVLKAMRPHAGFTSLLNEETLVRVQGAVVHVSGLDYPPGKQPTKIRWITTPLPHPVYLREFPNIVEDVGRSTQKVDSADFRLSLAHHPDNFEEIRKRGVELTLSGHTHGGQVAPVGTYFARAVFKYNHGLYREGNSHVYVNGGTGHWWPLRIGIPAEVTELTLRRV